MRFKYIKNLMYQKSVKNILIYVFGQLFNLFTPLLAAPYLIYVCGEENYGKIGVSLAISFFLIVIIDYGSEIIGVKNVAINANNKTKLEHILATTYLAKFLLLIVILLLFIILFITIPYFKYEKKLFLFGLLVVVGQFLNPTWFFQGIENFKAITILNITSKVLYILGVFLFIKQESDYFLANLFWGIGTMIANFLIGIFYLRNYNLNYNSTTKKEIIIYLKDNFSMVLSQMFLSLQLYLPILLIGFIGGNIMAGKFKILDQIIVMFKTYIFLFFNYVYPRVCSLISINFNQGIKFWRTYNLLNIIFISICMIIIYLFAKPIVQFFNPTAVTEIVCLLKFGVFIPFFLSISISLKQLVLALNLDKKYIRITMIMVSLNLILITLLITKFEIFGVIFSIIFIDFLIILYFIKIILEKKKSTI